MLQSQSTDEASQASIPPSNTAAHAPKSPKLSAEAAEYVRVRMEQEMLSIDSEHDRLVQAMNDEILHVKQRLLYNICGKMQEFAQREDPTLSQCQELYPDVFCRFSQKGTRQKMRRKPKLAKPCTDMAALDRPLGRPDLLFDLNGSRPRRPRNEQTTNEVALMTTLGGQKWVARRTDGADHVQRVTYCDGSSSLLSGTDAKTLGISFSPLTRK
jgi:hypothetical protein